MNISFLSEKTSRPISTFINGIVFIDPKVDGDQMLMAGVTPGLEVVLLDDNQDGIRQITQVLKGRSGLSSLHIMAHGEAGSLWLGNGLVDSKTLDQQKDDLLSWKAALAADADIFIYGDQVAEGENSQQFVQLLGELTGADVAASRNLTGNVEAPIAFGVQTMEAENPVHTTTRVSVASDGTQGNGASFYPSLSADGRYVAFYSVASNLVSGDTNKTFDVFVHDTVTNTTRRVSVASDGTQGNGQSYAPSLSADGRYVVFSSAASNLVSGDTNNAYDVFVHDTVTNTTRRVSVASDGTQGNSNSHVADISADGRYVVFDSDANNLVNGDTNGVRDIFVHDTVTNTTRRVSVSSDGTQGNGQSYAPSLSADGRYVVFSSAASNLVSGDTNGTDDTFVYDTVTNTIRRVSVDSNGIQGNGQLFDVMAPRNSISADGSRIVFSSNGNNLVSGDTNNDFDIFLYDSGNVNQNPWTGTPGDDTYTYTGTADFTGNGLAGNDTIVGGIANDYILGGAGNDLIKGGLGNDIINGNEGNDFVYGGKNHDFLIGEDGSDYLWGGFGNDLLVGYGLGFTNSEIDTLFGGRGADTFSIGLNFTYFGGTGMIPTYASNGDADYALIGDFTTRDVIELYGNINQYTFSNANVVGSTTPDTLIYWKVENTLELVAVVQDVTNVPVENLVFFT